MTGGASHQDAKRANKWNEKEHQLLKARAEEAQRELASLGTVHAGEEAPRPRRSSPLDLGQSRSSWLLFAPGGGRAAAQARADARRAAERRGGGP